MSAIRTYTLDHYAVSDPDGCRDVVLSRPLAVTVGTQALEPGVSDGKTIIRFCMYASNPLLERKPKMRLKVLPSDFSADDTRAPTVIDNPALVELSFDNAAFVTERKEMPFWLVDTLEFAAKTLRAQYELNQLGPVIESADQ